MSTQKLPTIFPKIPENDAKQFARAAPRSLNPIFCRRKVPKKETAIIPLKLTVAFNNIEIKSALQEALKNKFKALKNLLLLKKSFR